MNEEANKLKLNIAKVFRFFLRKTNHLGLNPSALVKPSKGNTRVVLLENSDIILRL